MEPTGGAQLATLDTEVMVDYGQLYFGDASLIASSDADADWLQTFEDRAGKVGDEAIIVITRKQAGPTRVVLRVVASLPDDPEPADHVVDLSLAVASGSVRVTGWDRAYEVGGDVEVPPGPIRARVSWHGLAAAAALDGAGLIAGLDDVDPEWIAVDLAPGDAAHVAEATVRTTWREWAAPEHEGRRANGLRRLAGTAAAPSELGLEPITDRVFWDLEPRVDDGYVQALYRDPATGTMWAHGRAGRHPFLVELEPAEAERIASEGFPSGYWFARDSDGRVWTCEQIPMPRTKVLNLAAPDRPAFVRSLGLPVIECEMPEGFSRLTFRDIETGAFGEVEEIEEGRIGYQRWRDGEPLPGR